jgi:hypothetical protein
MNCGLYLMSKDFEHGLCECHLSYKGFFGRFGCEILIRSSFLRGKGAQCQSFKGMFGMCTRKFGWWTRLINVNKCFMVPPSDFIAVLTIQWVGMIRIVWMITR